MRALSIFIGAAAAADLADGVRAVALPLLAVALTREPAAVAGLGVAQSAPVVALGLLAGVLADRVDRRRLLVATQAAETMLFAGAAALVALEVANIPLLYVVALCLGANETVRDTAFASALPAVAGGRRLESANGRLVTAGFVGQQLLGPALGTALFALAAGAPLVAAAALTLAGTVAVAALPALRPAGEPGGGRAAADHSDRGALVGELLAGVAFLARHRVLRTIALLAVVLTVTDAAWFAVLVLLVTDELGYSEWAYGVLLAVAAVGGVAGGWLADRIIARLGAAVVLRWGVVVVAAAQLVIGLAGGVAVVGVGVSLGNAALAVWLTAAVSLRQTLTPDRLLGRVTAAWRTTALAGVPVGMLAGGLLAQTAGVRAPLLAGVPVLLVAAVAATPLAPAALRTARPSADGETGSAPSAEDDP